MQKETKNKVTKMVDKLIAKGEIKVRWVDIDSVKENKKNPRKIKPKDFEELKLSITDFPDLLRFRPGIIDEDNNLLGGNMRHRACKSLGWIKFPVIEATDLTVGQLKELMIKDNISAGAWDNKLLKDDWDINLLSKWGVDTNPLMGQQNIPGEIVFSPELDQHSNYVILKFDKDIDWLHIKTILGLQSVYGKRANGKPWAKGVGRVIDGLTAIQNIKKSNSNL